ncbi:MAG: M48 family metallopeptidase [Burkholderiales bacterium]
MAASFFEQQAVARRRTHVLVLLYLLAVAAVVSAVVTLAAAVYLFNRYGGSIEESQAVAAGGWVSLLPPGFLAAVAIATAGVIFAVSLTKILRLAGSGEEVARMVGARQVVPNTTHSLERRLLNVVEEMAIAAGVRVPAVYIMDGETGINAFAAGYDVSNAVVAVTQGTIERLNREELQGVIGHEFSHILNGDMRLNVRMLGVLEGIVFLSAMGAFLMRHSTHIRGRKASAALGLLAVGLGLFVIGYIGLFFARLIKAAVSRQREFLADASSVQFTRNPDGLAGALDQIGLLPGSARISNRYAEEMAHMYFGEAIHVWLGGLFATHPPLDERIARACPGFSRTRYRAARGESQPREGADRREGIPGVAFAAGATLPPNERRANHRSSPWPYSAARSAALVGQLDAARIDYASRLLSALPSTLRERVREPEGARATVIALLLAHENSLMREQLDALREKGLNALAEAALGLVPVTRGLAPSFRLPVADLALPTLKWGTAEAKRELLSAAEVVILADRRMSVHEFIVLTLLRTQLADRPRAHIPKYTSLALVREHVLLLLSLVAQAGARGTNTAETEIKSKAAFAAGVREAQLGEVPALTKGGLNFDSTSRAVEELRRLAPLAKAMMIRGLFATATHDGSIRIVEAELLRLMGAVLDCPLPPLFDETDLEALAA